MLGKKAKKKAKRRSPPSSPSDSSDSDDSSVPERRGSSKRDIDRRVAKAVKRELRRRPG